MMVSMAGGYLVVGGYFVRKWSSEGDGFTW